MAHITPLHPFFMEDGVKRRRSHHEREKRCINGPMGSRLRPGKHTFWSRLTGCALAGWQALFRRKNCCLFRRGIRWRALHCGEKAISDPGKGLNEARAGRIVVQDCPQLGNGLVQPQIKINECVPRPYSSLQFLPGDNFSGLFQQGSQHLERLPLDADFGPKLAQLKGAQVNLEDCEAQHTLPRDRALQRSCHWEKSLTPPFWRKWENAISGMFPIETFVINSLTGNVH